ncbi:MAG: hypothetical protein PHC97_03850 [Patescibacteria group bacterium]|nr:hypothetical protein [Patescibacteria group bacterium]
MKITICGSIAFFKEMKESAKNLEDLGHEVLLPPVEVSDGAGKAMSVEKYYELRKGSGDKEDWVWDTKERAMRDHFEKVMISEAILVLNYRKNNIDGYIGANTFLEMGLAFHNRKKIFLLNRIPDVSFGEEILGMKPIILNGDLTKIK